MHILIKSSSLIQQPLGRSIQKDHCEDGSV